MASHRFLDESLSRLQLDRSIQILGHLLARHAHQSRIELKAQVWLEGDVHLLLGLGIHYALMVVKLEAIVENFLDLGALFSALRS